MACHYVMLIAKPDYQNRLLPTGSKVLHTTNAAGAGRRGLARVTTIRTTARMEGRLPSIKAVPGSRTYQTVICSSTV
jgi:hypothetical protein